MLHEFVTAHSTEIISRTRAKVALRSNPAVTDDELENGVPLFLAQLVEALATPTPTHEAIGPSAARHGANMLRMGYTIAQVVHDYGDVCQAVTELAEELRADISIDEFHTLNRCLDDAIAEAVSEYSRLRQRKQTDSETDRIGALAHEMRNRLASAMLAYEALKGGRIGIGGSTAAVVDRSLRGLRDLIDGALAEVRIESGKQNWERVLVSDLLEEIEIDATLDAHDRGMTFVVKVAPRGVEIRIDRAILTAALHNLLQNAFKFSRARGQVELTTTVTADTVIFEVEDECGGLPLGAAEELFTPYTQKSDNKIGMGLGLSISRKGIESHGGHVGVRDIPGKGCVFFIEVPRHPSSIAPTPFPAVKIAIVEAVG
ncbi:MAG: HAMP domain-containing sensor histidine kinase [Gemmatimonadaceae bacterium]